MSILDEDVPYGQIVATQFRDLWRAGGNGGKMMRTGADYRDTLRRDGRKVWVLGEGLVEDVTTHPATGAMVEEYVAWYDRHLDPAWQDVLIAPPSAGRERTAWAYVLPKNRRTT